MLGVQHPTDARPDPLHPSFEILQQLPTRVEGATFFLRQRQLIGQPLPHVLDAGFLLLLLVEPLSLLGDERFDVAESVFELSLLIQAMLQFRGDLRVAHRQAAFLANKGFPMRREPDNLVVGLGAFAQ